MVWKAKDVYKEIYPGVFSCYPLTRDDAIKKKIVFYHPTPCLEPCLRPGHEPDSLRYTRTGISKCCAIRDALHAYQLAVERGEPTSLSAGKDYYWVSTPGKMCGHVGKRTVTGGCFICKTTSPRKVALAKGDKWYMPENPCPRCGVVAMRRVANGVCANCNPERLKAPLRLTNPDLIISRKDAKLLGLKTYRTGEPCINGHDDYRYTCSGNCVLC